MKDERLAGGEEQSQGAFDEAGFELEAKSGEVPTRTVGILAFHGAPSPLVETDLKEIGAAESDGPIAELITRWENLTPQQLLKQHKKLALDPFVAFGEWVVPIDHNRIEAWLHGEYLARALAERPRLESRSIEVQKIKIVYIGRNKAVATYRVVERYQDSPKVYSGNAAVILVHLAKGWRIAGYTKDGSVGT